LPLSLNDESGEYSYFPGETWEGKTWLEQNRIISSDNAVLRAMLKQVPGTFYLRYLLPSGEQVPWVSSIDEIGYFFYPGRYGYDLEHYFGEFSHKSAKRLKKELAAFTDRGAVCRYDRPDDFALLVDLNLSRYGENSYFHDQRFLASFHSLVEFLLERGWLRMTTVLIDGEVAAADMGCVYNGTYTLLAGGTNASFPGAAKFINMHHMARACDERFDRVDFLCGDFSWKTLFHLSPRPLYLLKSEPEVEAISRVKVSLHEQPLSVIADTGGRVLNA
jgi:hypothetical protein